MTKLFNPPPGWPTPPEGWQPGPDWTPDPRWQTAPSGWQFWIDTDPVAAAARETDDGVTRIFISYRRSDTQAHANGLFDGLATRLPEASIFMDLDSIPAGVDFEDHIRAEIDRCDVVLVVIGDDWLAPDTQSGERRIDDPEDFVRLEIENALTNPGVVVIPLLVEGARMPSSTHLPEDIKRLARINALEMNDTRWRSDMSRLVARVKEIGDHQKSDRADVAKASEHGPVSHAAASFPPRPPEQQPVTYDTGPIPTWQEPPPATTGPIFAMGITGPIPVRPRMSGAQITLSLVMCVLPIASLGLLAFATPLIAAGTRVQPGSVRNSLWLSAIGFAAAIFLVFMLYESAPTSSETYGWQGTVATLLLVACMGIGTWIGIAFWRPRP